MFLQTQPQTFLQSIEGMLIAFLAVVMPALALWIVAQLRANHAATKVVEEKTDRNAQVIDNTHTLVNSQMGAQLQLNATATQALANATHDPVHVAAAQVAQAALTDHNARQAVVDMTPAGKAFQPSK
jgi:hypothetical protein